MQVLLAPDSAATNVAVNVTYLVGSRHEGYGETGMAHLLEHLIFKGTPSTPDPKAEFRKRGFSFNGTTAVDRTNYFASFTYDAAQLDWYLSWQADAMTNSFIAKKDLDSEMTVVRNEYEIAESNPAQALVQRMQSVAYQWHNYGNAVIGARSDIENVDIVRLQDFYRRYYRPDNAFVVIAGKFDEQAALQSIVRHLGALKAPAVPIPQTYTLDLPQDGERSVTVRRAAQFQVLAAGYHTPAALHKDTVPLALLNLVLADAPSGRLYKALVETKKSQGVFAAPLQRREASMLLIGTVIATDAKADELRAELLPMLEGIASQPITQEEFDRARNKAVAGIELAFSNAARVASTMTEMQVMGDWRAFYVHRDQFKTVTLADVNRVATTYLLRDNRTLGQLIPTQSPVRAPAAQLSDAKAYLAGVQFKEQAERVETFDYDPATLASRVSRHVTPAGIKVTVASKPVRGDVVTARMVLRLGNESALNQRAVAAQLMASMLIAGTPTLSRQQLDDQLVKLGAAVTMNGGPEQLTVNITVKKDRFEDTLKLVAQLLKQSSFPQAVFDEFKAATVATLKGQAQDKAAQARNEWARYGNPYKAGDVRYAPTLQESLAAWEALTLEQVRDFHRNFAGAQAAQLGIVGPVDTPRVHELVAQLFDGWKAPQGYARIARPLVARKPAELRFATPDRANATVEAYTQFPMMVSDPEYLPLQLATRMLGGGPNSRLWTRLREREGMSYDVGASVSAASRDASASFSMQAEAAPQNLDRATQSLKAELQRALKDGFDAKELEAARTQFVADRKRVRSGDAWLLGIMMDFHDYDYPFTLLTDNDARVARFTLDEVNAVLRKHVKPDGFVWGSFVDTSKLK
jgi:zinc protease